MALPDLVGKVAVVTGASRGLGAGLAFAFHAHGMRLGLCSRGKTVLAESEGVVSAQVDVRDDEEVSAFCERVEGELGRIDLWVNNAGVLEPIGPVREITPHEFEIHVDTNLAGVFHGTRAYLHHLRRVGGPGVLINVSSGAAEHPYAGWGAYCAAKAAVDRLTECVALEEREHGLRAYVVAPGIIDTDMQELIRRTPRERFPAVDRFLEIQRTNAFNTPGFVAARLLEIAFDPERAPSDVIVRLPVQSDP
jgi:NAD(P)-dependent dehydrogenase (short-subunit alcohol dehydrogenase family)